ncbi:hypothetical protein IE81DRAFT_228939 [Ceraceosorus guamensis]|uniref:Uncharacterized protein n=1 Tax=Ceraceosorus guamensis TaxID=1522189 RepID=A0A316WBZ3_9BASI|nr:hypothetical protein IE81DRAFT_228939 [Ceraceosorus guamensis]PWN45085.1 hypothetical protein IE81DRAFT_228939 [Ceraceosorus guamensis]
MEIVVITITNRECRRICSSPRDLHFALRPENLCLRRVDRPPSSCWRSSGDLNPNCERHKYFDFTWHRTTPVSSVVKCVCRVGLTQDCCLRMHTDSLLESRRIYSSGCSYIGVNARTASHARLGVAWRGHQLRGTSHRFLSVGSCLATRQRSPLDHVADDRRGSDQAGSVHGVHLGVITTTLGSHGPPTLLCVERPERESLPTHNTRYLQRPDTGLASCHLL